MPVKGSQITAGDLASIDPAFAGLPADKPLMLAPRAGVERYLNAADIRRIAVREGIVSETSVNACFSWPTTAINPETVRRTMTEVLQDSTIEILEVSNVRMPPGSMEFDRRGLSVVDNAAGVFLWRGSVRYAERQLFPIWARVRISVKAPCAVAADQLATAAVITAESLRDADQPLPATVAVNCVPAKAAIGKRTRRPIRSGETLRNTDLESVPAISAGDEVSVDVYHGRAHISLVAKAEGRGAEGDQIFLRNPRSGKRFQARVSAPGRAEVGDKGVPQ